MAAKSEIVCLKTSLKIYRFYRVFPPKGVELNPGSQFFLKFIALALISSVPLVGSILHMIKTIQADENNHLELDLTWIVSFSSSYCLIVTFFVKVTQAAAMYYFFSDFKTFGKPPHFDQYDAFIEKLGKAHYVYLTIVVAMIVMLSNLLKSSTCELENIKHNLTEICGLFSYTWLPFNINFFPAKQVYLAIQLFGVEYIYMLAGLSAWMVVETVHHLVVRIKHVKLLFLEAIKETDWVLRRRKFNFAVNYHVAVLDLEVKLNNCFGIFMLNHMVISAAVLGSCIYAFSHGKSLASLFLCVGWFLGLMMDCMTGQRLKDESLKIGEALYNSNWYDCDDLSIKKDMILVLMRSRRAMHLKAASFGVMDRATFVSVLKATYSFIALLQSNKNH